MHSTAQPHAVPPHPGPEPEPAPTPENPEPDDKPTGPDLDALKSKAQEAIDRSSTWIRQNPAAAVGIAIASGFLVGRMIRK